jgi:NAD(P)-dependent dehydrogenase (short-subunit alcohol dehydrogenase family)
MVSSAQVLAGKRALVTGGAAGIGLCIAQALSAAGARVMICDVNAQALAETAADHPQLQSRLTDIADRAAVDATFAEIDATFGGLDILVNNAGISGMHGLIENIDPDDWTRVFAVNVHGTFHCTQRAIPRLKSAGGGSIINISSVSGRLPNAYRASYSSSKFALVGFTECLALELGSSGIRANAILPGIVRGARWYGNAGRRAQREGLTVGDIEAASLARVATGRMVEPDEIAATAVFLASDAARSITGQSISVCGYLQSLSSPVARDV